MEFKQLRNAFPVIPLFSLFALQSTVQESRPLDPLVKETKKLRQRYNYRKCLSPFRSYIKDAAQSMINTFIPYTANSLKSIKLYKRGWMLGLGAVCSNRDCFVPRNDGSQTIVTARNSLSRSNGKAISSN